MSYEIPTEEQQNRRLRKEIAENRDLIRFTPSSTNADTEAIGAGSHDLSTGVITGNFVLNPERHYESIQISWTSGSGTLNIGDVITTTVGSNTWEGKFVFLVGTGNSTAGTGIFEPQWLVEPTTPLGSGTPRSDFPTNATTLNEVSTPVKWTATYTNNTVSNNHVVTQSASIIMDKMEGGNPSINNIFGAKADGQFTTIKPKEGKTLVLKPNGNIDVSQDTNLLSTEIAILQFQEDNTTPNSDGSWTLVSSGGGSGAIKSPVKYATTANITLSGEQSIDGTTTVTNRVLVKNQTTSSQNGIYVTASGSWSRSTDMSTGSTIEGGTMVYVTDGTVNGDNLFGLTTEGTVTVGTGNQAWVNLTSSWVDTATSPLNMDGNAVFFDLKVNNKMSILYNGSNLNYTVDVDGGAHNFYVDDLSSPKIGITETKLESNVPLDMNLNYVEFQEISTPSTPSANHGFIYAKDVSGVTTPMWSNSAGENSLLVNTSGFVTLTGNNNFTGINSFTNATGTFTVSTPTVSLGTGAGNINILGVVASTGDLQINDDVDLLVHKIKNITSLWYDSTGTQSVYATSGGIGIKVPTGDAIDFFVNSTSTPKLGITELSVESNVRLNVNNQAIFFDGTNLKSSILYLSNALNYIVDIDGGSHDFFVDDLVTPKFGITETSIESNVNFNMNNMIITWDTAGTYKIHGGTGAGGMDFNIPNSANHGFDFKVGTGASGVPQFGITNTSVESNVNLDMNGMFVYLDGSTYSIVGNASAGGMEFQIPSTSGFGFDFKVGTGISGNPQFGITNTEIGLNVALDMNLNPIKFQAITGVATPTGNEKRFLFSDSANSDELSVKLPNGSIVSLEGGGGASGANLTLSNLSSPIAINQTLLPNVASGVIYSLGSSSAKWRSVFTERLGFGTTAMTMPTNSGNNGEVLTTNGSSTLSWTAVSGGSQTPWTSQISAGNNALVNANSIQFSNQNQTAVSSTIPYIQFDNYDFIMNAPSDRAIELKIGGQGFISLVGNATADRVIQIQRRIDMGGNYIQFDGMSAPNTVSNEPLLFANSGNSSHLSIRTGSGSIIDLEASSSSGADTDLNNLTTTSVNQSLIPETDGGQNLGSSSKYWNYLYASTRIKLQGRMDFNGSNSYTYIDQNQYGLDFQTPSGSTWDFYVDSDKILEIDDEGLMVHHTSTSSSGRSCIRANNSSYEIGFHTTASTSVGSEGAMGAPYNSRSGRETSSTNLNNRYGSTDGCIGIQHDTSNGYAYLYAKTNGSWKYSVMVSI